MSSRFALMVLLAASVIPSLAVADGHTFYVTNYGSDSAGCGTTANPCRSISQAIENASPNDAIAVGAGRYGDLNGNGSYADPGDEHPRTLFVPLLTPNGHGTFTCIVCIDKPLRLYSMNGSAVTVIQGIAGSGTDSAVVAILSTGVVFGSVGRGFTVSGRSKPDASFYSSPNTLGVVITSDTIAQAGTAACNAGGTVTVAGNVDRNDTFGFLFNGLAYAFHISCTPGSNVSVTNNTAIANHTGFTVHGNFHVGAVVLLNNLATGATATIEGDPRLFGAGFSVDGGTAGPFEGEFSYAAVSLLQNVATGCDVGFNVSATGFIAGNSLQNNTASGNAGAGFMVSPQSDTTGSVFTGNSALGNAGPGLIVAFGNPRPGTADFSNFTRNNFFGNDRNRPPLTLDEPGFTGSPGPSAHCGVLNVGAVASIPPVQPIPGVTFPAGNSYWGSARGPQSNGPGDAVGGVCDLNGSVTTFQPFLTAPAAIASLP